MDEVTIENFRCFRERQTARLAPLTLLVGENSTGKTSLLAMVRILWNAIVFENQMPRFKDELFDLGTFREVAYQSEKEGSTVLEFSGGFTIGNYTSEVKFRKGNVNPEVFKFHIENKTTSVTFTRAEEQVTVEAKTLNGNWYFSWDNSDNLELELANIKGQPLWGGLSFWDNFRNKLVHVNSDLTITTEDMVELMEVILKPYRNQKEKYGENQKPNEPYATAPVRASPNRTYHPGLGRLDPKGEGVPAYLAEVASSDDERWEALKDAIEIFGEKTGMFDEIYIRRLGDDRSSDPFQIQVRKTSGDGNGQWRNLIDVGYGVSQILPLIVELTSPVDSSMILLQQPELHLHPSAQAGLGSMLCDVASKRQILVETHSDYLINRVRMDVRDKKFNLKPEDVSILYFERTADDVQIHNIRIDENGNINNSPPSYREFFSKEINRSLGI